jgi:hypothetical protein
LAAEGGIELGQIRIRHGGTGNDLEVYGRGRLEGVPVRAGFSLRSAMVGPAEALHLFVEAGRGSTKKAAQRLLPGGADETQTIALLRRLLKIASR